MFVMFGRTWAPQKGAPDRPENVGQQRDIFCPDVGPLYVVLRHLNVYLVQHSILWPGGSVRRIAESESYINVRKFM